MGDRYIDQVVENAIKAAEQWDKFAAQCEDVKSFRKAFHLRPTASEKIPVTIVSTVESKPMRGKHVGKTVITKHLTELNKIISSHNETEISGLLKDYGFKERANQTKRTEEQKLQAKMIREMEENQALKEYLQVDKLFFVASEFVLKSDGKKIIDIIGYDGTNRVFFFELKAPGNTNDNPIDQVKSYWLQYGTTMREETLSVLRNYPNKPIQGKDIVFEGYAVVNYSNQIDKANSKIALINEKEPGNIVFR